MITTQHKRIIGKKTGEEEGPAIFVFAGLHGNEPAGVTSMQHVFDMIETTSFRGKFIGLRGNIAALERGVRYIDEDMNRIWFPSIIEQIRRSSPGDLQSNERREIKELLQVIDEEMPLEGDQPVIFVDLHTFSAEGSMFAITSPKKQNTDLLSGLNIPMVFGIEEALRGTALKYFQNRDVVAFALEGGNHESDLTVHNNIAAMIILLQFAGNINSEEVPEFDTYARHLIQHTRYLPGALEFVYQHMIEPGDNFEMRPGYQNFEPVKQGEWLATDKNGKILAHCDGYLIMPLYQNQGDDGFFIVQEQA